MVFFRLSVTHFNLFSLLMTLYYYYTLIPHYFSHPFFLYSHISLLLLYCLCPPLPPTLPASTFIPLVTPLPQVKSPILAGLTDDSGRTLTSSDFNLRCLTPDQRVEGLLAFSSHEELDRFNQEARHGNRHPELFALYPPADEVR